MCEYLYEFNRCCGDCYKSQSVKECPDCGGKMLICDECDIQDCEHNITFYTDYDFEYERLLCPDCAIKLRDKLEQQQKEIMAKAQKEVDCLARDIDCINKKLVKYGVKKPQKLYQYNEDEISMFDFVECDFT